MTVRRDAVSGRYPGNYGHECRALIWLAFVVALAAGAAVGFINGSSWVQQKCEPFIITLGMGILLKGICQQITNAHPLGCKNPSFMDISNAKLFGAVPSLVVYMLLLGAAFYYLMRYTSYGRNCYAIGGNYDVAKYPASRSSRSNGQPLLSAA
ncbi:MAG: ABC transporter permease [Oscillospiraceae bacterium]